MKINFFVLAVLCFALVGCFVLPGLASAQTASFPDIPENHWAYQAVQDLANKGYVKGYPNGKFLGDRTLTRFEFATVIDRMVQELEDLNQKVAQGQAPTTPTGAQVTQDDLNKIQVLVDGFKDQLAAIQSAAATQAAQFQSDMDKLRSQLATVKNEADNSFGAGPGRKYSISGYVQERLLADASGDKTNFPQGSPTSSNAYNGTYGAGSNSVSFVTRHARLRVAGQVTQNSAYDVQIEATGFSNNTPSASSNSSNAAVVVKEAWASYTLGDGSDRYPKLTFGQFATPFGYILPLTSAAFLTPERPLAFNEGSAGIFSNDDYSRGVMGTYGMGPFNLTAAVVNDGGTVADNDSRGFDQIYRIGAHTPAIKKGSFNSSLLSGDVSYYSGHLPSSPIGTGYIGRERQLVGVDAQITSPAGPFVVGEYVSGKYEQRGFFGETAATSTNPFGFGVADAPNNKINGYYVQGGWTFDTTGNHPLTLFGDYDFLNRSASGVGASATGGASGSSFDDENVGYGVLYSLDKAIRLRLYYVQPDKVAHPAGTAEPPRVGLTTAEVQVKY